jgi:hypothetical protein
MSVTLAHYMAYPQPWERLSRAFERNPPEEDIINQFLDLFLLFQDPHAIYCTYNYFLELFTHGPILPNYLHIIYKHFHQNNVYGIHHSSLFHYYHTHPFGNRIFRTLEIKAVELYRAAQVQMEMEQIWM